MSETRKAPFTKKELKNLRRFQKRRDIHPFTCGRAGCEKSQILIPTEEGMKCPCGKYNQTWVHEFMTKNQPGRDHIIISVPLGLCKFKIQIKWRNNFQNFNLPWFGVGFYPNNNKLKWK